MNYIQLIISPSQVILSIVIFNLDSVPPFLPSFLPSIFSFIQWNRVDQDTSFIIHLMKSRCRPFNINQFGQFRGDGLQTATARQRNNNWHSVDHEGV